MKVGDRTKDKAEEENAEERTNIVEDALWKTITVRNKGRKRHLSPVKLQHFFQVLEESSRQHAEEESQETMCM